MKCTSSFFLDRDLARHKTNMHVQWQKGDEPIDRHPRYQTGPNKMCELFTTNLFAFLKMKILQTSVGTGQVDFRPLREHAPKVRCPVCNKKISYDPLAICFSVLDIT